MTASINRSLPPSASSPSSKPSREQVAGVVRHPQVGLGVGPRFRPAVLGVGVHDDRDLGGEQRAVADPLAGQARVLDGREVRVCAKRSLGGELEHLRPERRDDALVAGHRRVGVVEPVEEVAHLRERLLVPAGRLRMPNPDPEQEALAEVAAQVGVTGRDVRRLVAPHVQDAGGDGQRGGRLEVRARLHERWAPSQPERPEAERLDLCQRAHSLLVAAPDSNPSERHASEIGTCQPLPALVPFG